MLLLILQNRAHIYCIINERKQYDIKKGRNAILEPEPLFATSTNNELKSTAIEKLFQ